METNVWKREPKDEEAFWHPSGFVRLVFYTGVPHERDTRVF